MDSLITAIIVLVISGIATLVKKMSQARQDADAPPANNPRQGRPGSAPQPQRQTTSWEEELRRLLGEDSPPSAAPPPMRPPPPIVAPPPPRVMPVPPPVRMPAPMQPRAEQYSQPQRPPLVMPAPAPRPRPVVVPIPESAPVDAAVATPASLRDSERAYVQAAQLAQETSARIDRVSAGRVKQTTVERRPVSAEISEVVALFKSARTARQAVIASIILGPPPALEPTSAYF
jgi:hypothetical protein